MLECLAGPSTRTTHQVSVVLRFLYGAGVREEQHLRVGVDGEVKLNRVLVLAQEVGHGLGLWLRLGELAAVDLSAGLVRRPLRWKKHIAGSHRCCDNVYMNAYEIFPLNLK